MLRLRRRYLARAGLPMSRKAGQNLIEVMAAAPRGVVTDQRLLRKVLEGLHAL